MKKILFFDVDDTLIHHRGDKSYIPDSTKKAIGALQDKDHMVAIATGRGYSQIAHIMDMLGIDHAICFNGHMMVIDRKVVWKEALHREDITRLIKSLRYQIFPALAMDEEQIYVKDFFGKVKSTLKKSMKTVEGSSVELFSQGIKKLHSKPMDYYAMMFFKKHFTKEEAFPNLSFKRWGGRGFEVSNKGVSKLSGILMMSKHFGIDKKDIFVFGDNYNDLEMLEGIENSVAMGNAVEIAKQVASYTTAPVDEDGIEKACYYFGLIE